MEDKKFDSYCLEIDKMNDLELIEAFKSLLIDPLRNVDASTIRDFFTGKINLYFQLKDNEEKYTAKYGVGLSELIDHDKKSPVQSH